jgi:hypothetical protein
MYVSGLESGCGCCDILIMLEMRYITGSKRDGANDDDDTARKYV